ncbi:hypothetical protein D9758_017071 [Tetrapyrgos nigripes]|uniref:DUF4100 domain-containing protein n=1 Tax=Tetrapyrgos nigripes TaxID=182062 RepID=A0A8H5CHU0_9AGAR|nr:hypothetical protein D9758_017071 [Tetrapyrgos nigripes]
MDRSSRGKGKASEQQPSSSQPRPRPNPPQAQTQLSPAQPVPTQPPISPQAQQGQPSNTSIPPLTNPINREDGWKSALPSNNGSRQHPDVTMRDETKKIPPGPQFHFTSDIQEQYASKAVWEKIMDQPITLPLKQVIRGSPTLQKIFTESTRTRREYNSPTKASSPCSCLSSFDFASSNGRDDFVLDMVSSGLAVDADCDQSQLASFLVHYSSAIVANPASKFFVMVTGVMDVRINGVVFKAMIDTGSELNVASHDVPEQGKLLLDFEGMNWSLRGIHGGPECLAGVLADVPIQLGSYMFPHHIFVTRHSIADRYDIILGQPFLQWYACRLDYFRIGSVKLYLWKDADKERRPTVMVNIADPEDPRNTSVIGGGPSPSHPCPHHGNGHHSHAATSSQSSPPLSQAVSGQRMAPIAEVQDYDGPAESFDVEGVEEIMTAGACKSQDF